MKYLFKIGCKFFDRFCNVAMFSANIMPAAAHNRQSKIVIC